MANHFDPTPEQMAAYAEWTASRPESVRKIAERLFPWALYRMKSTGQRVTLVSIFEDGTIKVEVSGRFNALVFERDVFGIDPDDLEECDLPGEDEPLGILFPDEVGFPFFGEGERVPVEIDDVVRLPRDRIRITYTMRIPKDENDD